jgi:tyrosyl-tRNA synthetase
MELIENMIKSIAVGVQTIVSYDELVKKLQRDKPLTVKLGMDPTAPDLHLGHAVVLAKLRTFQNLGHNVVLIIGNFTASIGDPTGRSKTRPPLSREEIECNMKTYLDQVGKILDMSRTRVCYNADWLTSLAVADLIGICSKITLARLIEREDFALRLRKQQPIGFHELLYPLFQGYDSVVLKADVELGGTDQTFNLLCGRFLQEQYNQEPQIVITLPLLEGLDGERKMSKSYGNAIGLAEEPHHAFGKLMSISDTLMWRYYELLLNTPADTLVAYQQDIAEGRARPIDIKKNMAEQIIALFWSKQESIDARGYFEKIFQQKNYENAEPISRPFSSNPIWIVELIKTIDPTLSSSSVKRLIESNAISCGGERVTSFGAQIQLTSGMIVKVGKHRIYKIEC